MKELKEKNKETISENKTKNSTPQKISPSKRKKIVKKLIILLLLIGIITTVYLGYVNFRFSIREDLLITIPERHIDMQISSDNPAELEIHSTVQTSIFCKAICTHKLTSLNSRETIFSENFEFKRYHKIELEKTIYPYTTGEGQDIYVYSIACSNIETTNCPIKDSNIEKTAIITLSRELTQKEINLKQKQENTLNDAYNSLNNGLFYTDAINATITQFNFAKKKDLETELEKTERIEKAFKNSLLKTTEAWLTYNHSITEESIISDNITSQAEKFYSSSAKLYNDTLLRINEHNTAVNTSYTLADRLLYSENVFRQSEQFINSETENKRLNSELNETNSLILYSARNIISKNTESYINIFPALQTANISLDLFEERYMNSMKNNSEFAEVQLDLIFSKEDLCIISNLDTANNYTNTTSTNISKDTSTENQCEINMSEELINYIEINYTILSLEVLDFCREFNILLEEKEELEEQKENYSANLSNEFFSEVKKESARYRIYLLKKHLQELNNRTDYASNIAKERLNEHIESLEDENNISSSNIQINSFISSFNKSLLSYFTPANFTLTQVRLCEELQTEPLSINLSFEETPVLNFSIDSEPYKNILPELLPRACFNGECKPYIQNSSKNYPLIIVHGHGFYTKNTKVTPSQVHNELQNQLFQDNLYIPAGILNEEEKVIRNSLGYIDIPFVYKASYYPEEILNNESIELFADRLNTIISKAKSETSKDKVILVVHSMGGLVTRAYLKEYSTEDVAAVIIGGTPDYGVTSETVKLCKLFGRNLECDEMYEESTFISELKDEPKYNIPIYTLRGVGCPTFGADGDGIVASDKVSLSYAENFAFNGTCSLTGGFHVNLLSPKHNPEIYSKLKEILIENRN